ncbi:hypothetical protein B9Z19DRAFT_1064766 [Tuber borchii]|uniref:Uncharacterized protein n=1 Tax=Tuber borchii TaxID=42251 RepID=A0A2T6ZTM3_TUBBO|nr:hypothetical protein B9Z19DRAFT_1064766 [Tuber borchii]
MKRPLLPGSIYASTCAAGGVTISGNTGCQYYDDQTTPKEDSAEGNERNALLYLLCWGIKEYTLQKFYRQDLPETHCARESTSDMGSSPAFTVTSTPTETKLLQVY